MNSSVKYQQTIEMPVQIKNIIKKSRFIATVKEVEKEDEIKQFLKEITQEFPDANHHCWAYQIGYTNRSLSHYSDGGEPANSAGPPILQAIRKEMVTNVMVIVTRYFGGIKLGISGLIKAYRETALIGIQSAGKIKKYPLREYIFENIDYQVLGNIIQLIESQSGRIEKIDYREKVKIMVLLPDNLKEWLVSNLYNFSQGNIHINQGEIHWFSKK